MSDRATASRNGGSRPVPDPTSLTTEALQREVKQLGETLRAEIKGNWDGSQIRFQSINERFGIVESQRVEQKQDTQKAVDAALQAQKEAVREQTTASDKAISKSETSMIEQSKQQNATTSAELRAIIDKVNDLSGRLGTMEAMKIGGQEMRTQTKQGLDSGLGILGAVIGILGFAAAILMAFL